MLFAVRLLVLVFVAVAAGAVSAWAQPLSEERDMVDAGRIAEEQRQRDRASDAGRQARHFSRTRYRGLSATEALAAARTKAPSLYRALPWTGPRLLEGEAPAGYLDDYRMRVRRGDDLALIESTMPMRATDSTGDRRPVDLSLDAVGSRLVPKNPLVDFAVGQSLAQGVRLGQMDVRIVPGGAGATEGRALDAGVFFANILTDTDLLITGQPSGIETVHQLRSPASPETLRFTLELPAGTTVRPTPIIAPPGGGIPSALEVENAGFDIVRGEAVIGHISAPSAWDAQDEPVAVKAEMQGRDLVLSVPHRDKDVAYPIQVDPVVDYFGWRDGARGPAGTAPVTYDGWIYENSGNVDPNYWPGYTPTTNPSGISGLGWGTGLGLYTWDADSASYDPGKWARWKYPAYGNAFIFRAEFGYSYHKTSYTSLIRGIYAPSKPGGAGYDKGLCLTGAYQNCSTSYGPAGRSPTNDPWATSAQWETHFADDDGDATEAEWIGTPGNFAEFRLQKNSRSRTGASYVQFGTSYIYQWDTIAPRFENWGGGTSAIEHSGPLSETAGAAPTKWGKGGSVQNVRAWVRDDGLGVRNIAVKLPNKNGGADAQYYANYNCETDQSLRRRPCPDRRETTISYPYDAMPEGINTARMWAEDYSQNTVERTWQVKVDRTAPDVEVDSVLLDPSISSHPGDRYEIEFAASDSRADGVPSAGVTSMEVRVDGTTVHSAAVPACPAGSCDFDAEPFRFDATQLSGTHRFEVVAVDAAGNVGRQEWYATFSGTPVTPQAATEERPAPIGFGSGCPDATQTTIPLLDAKAPIKIINGAWTTAAGATAGETTWFFGSGAYQVSRCDSLGALVVSQLVEPIVLPSGTTEMLVAAESRPSTSIAGEILTTVWDYADATDPGFAAAWAAEGAAEKARVIPPTSQ